MAYIWMMVILRLIVAFLFIPVLALAQEESIPLPSPGKFKSTSPTEESASVLDSLQVIASESGADIEISGNGALSYSYFSLANPARLIVDFRNVQSQLNCNPIENPYISAIRCYDLWRSGTVENAVRVVLEFKAHMRFSAVPRTDGLTLHLTAVQREMAVQTPAPQTSMPQIATPQRPPAQTTEPQRQSVDSNTSLAQRRIEEQRRMQDAAAKKRSDEQKRAEEASAQRNNDEQKTVVEPARNTNDQAKVSSNEQQPITTGTQEPTVPPEPLKTELPPSKVDSTTPKGKVLLPNGKVDLEPADADPALFFAVPSNSTDYVLGPEDVIELKVQQMDELNVTVRISGDGSVTLPFLNTVQVAGLTAVQAADKISKLLGEKYLQNPQVSVFAREFNSQKVSVIGAVTTPGTYPLTGPRTIIQMLAQAGGIRTDAGTNILIFRQDGNGRSTRLSIQRENLLVLGDPAWNILLRAGDVVNIPPQIQISVSLFGAVTTPGVYTLAAGSESTLLKAIARAGGLQRASKSGVKIKRKRSEGKEEIITINLGDILSGKKADVPLQDGDLIIINESFF